MILLEIKKHIFEYDHLPNIERELDDMYRNLLLKWGFSDDSPSLIDWSTLAAYPNLKYVGCTPFGYFPIPTTQDAAVVDIGLYAKGTDKYILYESNKALDIDILSAKLTDIKTDLFKILSEKNFLPLKEEIIDNSKHDDLVFVTVPPNYELFPNHGREFLTDFVYVEKGNTLYLAAKKHKFINLCMS